MTSKKCFKIIAAMALPITLSGCGFVSVLFGLDAASTAPDAPLAVSLQSSRLVTNTSPIPIQVAFTKDVTGFSDSDIAVVGGTKSSFLSTSASVYTVQVTPALAETTVTVDVPTAAATAPDGADTPAATTLTIVYDSVAPDVATLPTWNTSGTTGNPMLVADWVVSPSADLHSQAVIVYSDGACGTAVHTEVATLVATSYVYLGSNATTYSYKVKSVDEAGNESLSACSAGLVVDTAAPATPLFSSAAPASPSADTSPAVIGTASGDTVTINLYSNGTCTTLIGSGTKAAYESGGIDVAVAVDATTSIYARAVDASSNSSACSLLTTYVNDSALSGSSFLAGIPFSFGTSYNGSLGSGKFISPYNAGDAGALTSGNYPWSVGLTSDWSDANHGCRVTSTGEAYCWGFNSSAQLGVGDKVDRVVPTLVSGGLLFSDIGTGEAATCAVQKTTGLLYCWGYNGDGRLGNGTTTEALVPTAVTSTDAFQSVSGGVDYMCGLRADGKAYCWGSNSAGQLGIGSLTPTTSTTPVAVAGGLTFVSLSTGYQHVCGVTAAGAGYCWGLDTSNQLGTPGGSVDTAPTLVQGGYTWLKLTAGSSHSCGVTTGNAAYCWGNAADGKLGNGDTVTPHASPSLVLGSHSFKDVVAGSSHACAITTSDTAFCWGLNSSGQLGNDTLVSASSPVAVLGGKTFKQLSASYQQSCGMTLTNEIRCWGSGTFARLGNGRPNQATALNTVLTFTSVETGEDHACGIATSGAAYCWGSNGSGRLGDGTTTRKSSPTLVSGALSWKKISAGQATTCGITSTDVAYCWGVNTYGTVGNSSATATFSTPQLVSGGLTWTQISVGSTHACGIASGGAAYCWGRNNTAGYLGNGSTIDSNTPVAVSGAMTWISISAGNNFSCGVATGGTAYCWGSNGNNEHGNGGTSSSSTPTPVGGSLTMASVFAGAYGACGITASGAGYCWGYNGYGSVGDGTILARSTPAAVSGGLLLREISVGTYHTCAITTTGVGYCWGKGAEGANGSGTFATILSPAAIVDLTDVRSLSAGNFVTVGVGGP